MTEARDRIRKLLTEAMDGQHIDEQLDAVLEDLVTRIDAEPDLRREVIRNHLRSSMMSSVWMR